MPVIQNRLPSKTDHQRECREKDELPTHHFFRSSSFLIGLIFFSLSSSFFSLYFSLSGAVTEKQNHVLYRADRSNTDTVLVAFLKFPYCSFMVIDPQVKDVLKTAHPASTAKMTTPTIRCHKIATGDLRY